MLLCKEFEKTTRVVRDATAQHGVEGECDVLHQVKVETDVTHGLFALSTCATRTRWEKDGIVARDGYVLSVDDVGHAAFKHVSEIVKGDDAVQYLLAIGNGYVAVMRQLSHQIVLHVRPLLSH